jgi:LPXTG-site transpeptidase (sortase) family protein
MKFLAQLLILIGFLCCLCSAYFFWMRTDPHRLAFNNYQPAKVSVTQEKSAPQRIIIKDLAIDLPIVPAKITNNSIWETTDNGASYLSSSPLPGEKGNSIIYAHNWASLFGGLTAAKPGQKIEVMYANGSRKKFLVESTATVSQNEASILAPTKDKRITLYTCAGWFDTKRFVVVAVLDDGKSSVAKVDSE